MAGWRRVVELAMTCEEIERLTALSRSRTEPASRVSRAQMLLAYRENPSFCAVGQRVGVHHQTHELLSGVMQLTRQVAIGRIKECVALRGDDVERIFGGEPCVVCRRLVR